MGTRFLGVAVLSGIATYMTTTDAGQSFLYQLGISWLFSWLYGADPYTTFIGFYLLFMFPEATFGFLSKVVKVVFGTLQMALLSILGYTNTFGIMPTIKDKAMMRGWKKFKFFNRWNKGIRIGNKALPQQPSFSTLVHGGSGSGKTITIAIGTAINSVNTGSSGKGTLICTDPQNQIWQWTSGYFNSQNIHCLKFSPGNPEESCGFNPIALAEQMEDGADILAKTFIQHCYPDTGKNAFFVIGGETVLRCVLRAMVVLHRSEPLKVTLSNAYRLLSTLKYDREAAANYILALLQGDEHADTRTDFLASIGLRKQKNQKQSASVEDVIQTARAALAMFANPTVERLTCKNDIDFHSLRTHQQAIFLNITSTEMKRYAPLVNVLFSWLFEYILKEDAVSVQNQNCITMLIEEAGTIGAIESLDNYANLCRKLNTNLYMIAQDPLLQFQKAYGMKEGEIIYHTMQCHIIIPRLSVIGAKHASQLLGMYKTDNGTKKPLFDADDIMNLSVGTGIIKAKSSPPIFFKAPPFDKVRSLRKKTQITPLERSNSPVLPQPLAISESEIQGVNEIIMQLKQTQQNEQEQKMVERPTTEQSGATTPTVHGGLQGQTGTGASRISPPNTTDTGYQQTVF